MRTLRVTFLGPLGLLVLAAGALTVIAADRRRGRIAGSGIALVAICSSLAAIFAVTLVPHPGPNQLQLLPLAHTIRGLVPRVKSSTVINVVGNVALFLPLGATLCLLGLRRREAVRAGFVLSAMIEITQLFIPGRTTAVDDVLSNTLGALLGWVLLERFAPVRPPSEHEPQPPRPEGQAPSGDRQAGAPSAPRR
jgi:VanZ family protein